MLGLETTGATPSRQAATLLEPTPAERESHGGSGRTAVRWSAYGLAGAAGVGAVVLGVLALGANADFDAGATRIEEHDYADEAERSRIDRQARDDADRASSLALWTDVCIGVAAAGAITGTVLLLTAPSVSEDREAGLPLSVAAGPRPGGAYLRLDGRF